MINVSFVCAARSLVVHQLTKGRGLVALCGVGFQQSASCTMPRRRRLSDLEASGDEDGAGRPSGQYGGGSSATMMQEVKAEPDEAARGRVIPSTGGIKRQASGVRLEGVASAVPGGSAGGGADDGSEAPESEGELWQAACVAFAESGVRGGAAAPFPMETPKKGGRAKKETMAMGSGGRSTGDGVSCHHIVQRVRIVTTIGKAVCDGMCFLLLHSPSFHIHELVSIVAPAGLQAVRQLRMLANMRSTTLIQMPYTSECPSVQTGARRP